MDRFKDEKYIIERLTALWALNESGLGGFMHALNLSFTGVLVGGISIISISLIAYFSKSILKDLIKALTIVLLIKLAVSPHSPLTAYFAVTFQAVLGIFLYSVFAFRTFTYLLLGILTFVESAVQKIFTLTIIYGMSFWDAINIYGKWVTDKLSMFPNLTPSKLVMGTFIFIYACFGILFGLFINRLIKRINHIESVEQYQLLIEKYEGNNSKKKSKQRKRILFWIITIALILIAFALMDNELYGWQKAIYIVIRSITVLVLWIFVVSPFLMWLLKSYLIKKKSRYQNEIDIALILFPYLKSIIILSWKESKNKKGINRLREFITNCILFSMFFKTAS